VESDASSATGDHDRGNCERNLAIDCRLVSIPAAETAPVMARLGTGIALRSGLLFPVDAGWRFASNEFSALALMLWSR